MHLSQVKNIIVKLIVFCVAFQILNLSVHGGDLSKRLLFQQSIGASNQVDCLVEFVYEDICNLKGYDDLHDLALHNKVPGGHKLSPKFVDFQMPTRPIFFIGKTLRQSEQSHFLKWNNKYDYLFAQEITPPPPKIS